MVYRMDNDNRNRKRRSTFKGVYYSGDNPIIHFTFFFPFKEERCMSLIEDYPIFLCNAYQVFCIFLPFFAIPNTIPLI